MGTNNSLIKTTDKFLENLSEKEVQIAGEIYGINQLVPYPLNSLQIADWAISINKLLPDLKISDLERLIDDFKKDELEWNYNKGIQNIFNGLKSYHRPMVY